MFKKINIITNICALVMLLALTIYYYLSKNPAALPLAGITFIIWLIIIFAKSKTRKKSIPE